MAKIFVSKFPLSQSRDALEAVASWLRRSGHDVPENIADHPKSLLLALLPVLIPVYSTPFHVWNSPDVEPDGGEWVDFAAGCAFAANNVGIMRKRCESAADALGAISADAFVLSLEDARGYVHEFVGGPTQQDVEKFLRARRIEEAIKALDPQADADLLGDLQLALAKARPLNNLSDVGYGKGFGCERPMAA